LIEQRVDDLIQIKVAAQKMQLKRDDFTKQVNIVKPVGLSVPTLPSFHDIDKDDKGEGDGDDDDDDDQPFLKKKEKVVERIVPVQIQTLKESMGKKYAPKEKASNGGWTHSGKQIRRLDSKDSVGADQRASTASLQDMSQSESVNQ